MKNNQSPRSYTWRNVHSSSIRKDNRGYILDVIIKAVAAGTFIFSILLNIILIIALVVLGVSQKSRLSLQRNNKGLYTKEYIRGDSSQTKSFVVIDINGIISEEEGEGIYNFGYKENMVEGVKNRLKLVEKDPRAKGIILLVNSPGGTVTASDMIYHEIEQFKQNHSIPVITYIKNIGASGAYYIASASDYIFAYPTAITGSIGVIMYNFNFKGLMDKYGVKYVAIKSGKHKDLISPFKEIDPEEVKWMQGIVNELLDRFVEVVKHGRKNLSVQQIKQLADGRVYTAAMAKKVGLIDELGYLDDALKYLEKLTNVTSYSVYRYVRQKQFGGLLDIIRKAGSLAGYKGILPIKAGSISDRISDKNGIKTYYLMNTSYGNSLDVELY